MKQKDVFLNSEGDAWFARNRDGLATRKLPDEDPLLLEIIELRPNKDWKILEIGCGNGNRLAWLQNEFGSQCFGVEPSPQAVQAANAAGIRASIGTADQLPFEENFFDLVIFGFCLYLCDREDLFKIAAEANRVLKPVSWITIFDFYARLPHSNSYQHHEGVHSYKMAYETLFTWHPNFTCYLQKIRDFHEKNFELTDNPRDMVAISIIRKNARRV